MRFAGVKKILGSMGRAVVAPPVLGRHEITVYGNAQLDGDNACVFNGNPDSLSAPPSPDWNFGPDNLTSEMFFWSDGLTSTRYMLDIGGGFRIGLNNRVDVSNPDSGLIIYVVGSTIAKAQYGADGAYDDSTWRHLALVREGNVMKVYLDGVRQISSFGTEIITGPIDVSSSSLFLGSFGGSTLAMDGKLSRITITKGVAKYTSNFTPPLRSAPIILEDETVIALNFDGPAGSTDIKDSALP